MPVINLLPMMDVVMTILTFFVLVSMTLTNQKTLNIALPSVETPDDIASEIKAINPMIVGLQADGNISVENQFLSDEALESRIISYLENNPEGEIVLTVDKQASYDQLAKLLSQMQSVGGEQVSLAIGN
ncbi:MAG: biopolymer transporter ExbD [Limnothrix sp. RL_2_0]|nr:biopolymer transporter ExbD [Limnothrix sp. RL_2_0]